MFFEYYLLKYRDAGEFFFAEVNLTKIPYSKFGGSFDLISPPPNIKISKNFPKSKKLIS